MMKDRKPPSSVLTNGKYASNQTERYPKHTLYLEIIEMNTLAPSFNQDCNLIDYP